VSQNPRQVLLAVGVGTALSLMGDTALYAVLPTHAGEAGVTLASVGLLLSANRWIRLLLNGPAGLAYDRWPRRRLFLFALGVGTLSTALYGWAQGFWPLLISRLLWGFAWSGIWVGGNTIILNAANVEERGRLTGLYQLSFYFGSSLGFPVGGLLTDWLGFRSAMLVAAVVTGLGALAAGFLLREAPADSSTSVAHQSTPIVTGPIPSLTIAPAIVLYAVNRFVIAGVLSASLGLLIQQQWGALSFPNGVVVGVATLTGILLGLNTFISMYSAPLAGHWSDQRRSRWSIVALGITPGVLGMLLLAFGEPGAIVAGILLIALMGGSNQSLATALLGDIAASHWRGRALGWMHTLGDLSSGLAPLLVYAVLPFISLSGIYLACAALLAVLLLWAAHQPMRPKPILT